MKNIDRKPPSKIPENVSKKSAANSQTGSIKQVDCPTCQKVVEWIKTETFRPFCSKRCQLIDFGDWANEKNALPVTGPMVDVSDD